MKCPTCPDETLVISERAGVEIDYCPSCRGVWLDRGELDKLIERSASPQPAASRPRDDRRDDRHDDRHDDRRYDQRYAQPTKKKKAKSIFEELFDF